MIGEQPKGVESGPAGCPPRFVCRTGNSYGTMLDLGLRGPGSKLWLHLVEDEPSAVTSGAHKALTLLRRLLIRNSDNRPRKSVRVVSSEH